LCCVFGKKNTKRKWEFLFPFVKGKKKRKTLGKRVEDWVTISPFCGKFLVTLFFFFFCCCCFTLFSFFWPSLSTKKELFLIHLFLWKVWNAKVKNVVYVVHCPKILYFVSFDKKKEKQRWFKKKYTTFNGGSLGSCIDEERCEMR